MARDVSQRHHGQTTFPQINQTESTMMSKHSDRKVNMLPRFLVRVCGVAVIVALGLLVLVMQQESSRSISPQRNYVEKKQAVEMTSSRPTRRATEVPLVEVLAKYPHDTAAFTQGFTVVHRDNKKMFIESTGLFGASSLRHIDIESGQVLQQYDLPTEFFGEGVTLGPKHELVMLTWKNKIGLVFDLDKTTDDKLNSFTLHREFKFETVTGEGWGITYDGRHFIVSDGSSTIMFWDPFTMKEVRRIDVMIDDGKQAISHINELEVAKGFIYANVWYQPYILKINPKTGAVVTIFDLSKLVADAGVDANSGAVLNGIAYDDVDDVFYVTGKLWKLVYKVRLVDPA